VFGAGGGRTAGRAAGGESVVEAAQVDQRIAEVLPRDRHALGGVVGVGLGRREAAMGELGFPLESGPCGHPQGVTGR
jgi:hypothetical protein